SFKAFGEPFPPAKMKDVGERLSRAWPRGGVRAPYAWVQRARALAPKRDKNEYHSLQRKDLLLPLGRPFRRSNWRGFRVGETAPHHTEHQQRYRPRKFGLCAPATKVAPDHLCGAGCSGL